MGYSGNRKVSEAVEEMFKRLGVKKLEPWTRPNSFSGALTANFASPDKQNRANRGQSNWRTAEYIVVEDFKQESEEFDFSVWKEITEKDPAAPYGIQKILIREANNQYNLYDRYANKIASGSLEEIENFIQTNQTKADNLGLTVGMRSNEKELPRLQGFVTILDDDNYCYQVLCNSDEVDANIRTISKSLVKEFIDALRVNPEYNAEKLDNLLSGKSEIDKFEYGNNAVVYKLALMALGRLGHTLVDVSKYQNRQMGRSPQPKRIPLQDRLTIALKVFEEKRVVGDEPFTLVTQEELTKINGSYDYGQLVTALKGELKDAPKHVSTYLANDKYAAFMSHSLLTRLLAMERPEFYSACSEQTAEALHFLELTKTKVLPEVLTVDAYESSKAVQTQIRDKMREMKILSQDGERANYLTVAEFLKWVVENKKETEVTAMESNWKNVEQDLVEKDDKIRANLELNLTNKEDCLLYRLMVALRTKPFAILAGHSGTGKSRLVRRLARLTCNDKALRAEVDKKSATGNYLMVQVKPNWHDSTDLLGYYSDFEGRHYVTAPFVEFICKAYAYPKTPFFLCLDEMNLAPVEQYFAEYLSAIESMEKRTETRGGKEEKVWIGDSLIELDKHREGDNEVVDHKILKDVMKNAASQNAADWIQAHGLTIPKNLFVVGTVNMDDTTCQFSRKVLDRAMTIEMSEVDFDTFGQPTSALDADKAWHDEVINVLLNRPISLDEIDGDKTLEEPVKDLQKRLAETPFAIAYRFAKEYVLYRDALKRFSEGIAKSNGKIVGLQPSGTETEEAQPSDDTESEPAQFVRPITAIDQMVLMKVLPRIQGEKKDVEKIFNGGDGKKSLKSIVTETSYSADKMEEILGRGGKNPNAYLTFWP